MKMAIQRLKRDSENVFALVRGLRRRKLLPHCSRIFKNQQLRGGEVAGFDSAPECFGRDQWPLLLRAYCCMVLNRSVIS